MYTMGQSRIKMPVWIFFVIWQAHLEGLTLNLVMSLGHVVPAGARLTKTGTEQISRVFP